MKLLEETHGNNHSHLHSNHDPATSQAPEGKSGPKWVLPNELARRK